MIVYCTAAKIFCLKNVSSKTFLYFQQVFLLYYIRRNKTKWYIKISVSKWNKLSFTVVVWSQLYVECLLAFYPFYTLHAYNKMIEMLKKCYGCYNDKKYEQFILVKKGIKLTCI